MPSSTGTLVFNDQKIQAPDIYATESLGVGVSDPTSNLEVVGNAYVSSNLEVGTANLFVDTVSGRVGVGTASPLSPLHIRGDNCRLLIADSSENDADTNAFKCGIAFVDNTYDGTTTYAGNPAAGMGFFIGHASSSNKEVNIRNLTGELSFGTRNISKAMYINNSGNVGIGTASPSADIHISESDPVLKITDTTGSAGAASLWLQENDSYGVQLKYKSSGNDFFNLNIVDGGTETTRMVVDRSGRVGIGTVTPYAKLHVVGYDGSVSSATHYGFRHNYAINSFSGQHNGISIYANDDIVSGAWILSHAGTMGSSDERIKKEIVDIEDGQALSTLRLLKPKQYKYRDDVKRGTEPVWGFIAQEVRETLPYATQLRQDVLPNIYELANVSASNVITFTNFNTSNLESNATTLIRTTGIDGEDHDIHLAEVIDEHSIRVEEDLTEWIGSVDESGNVVAGNQLFIYGQEVDDFVFLKKEAIWTIATSALQEVDRQLQAEKAKVATLETQLASVLTRLDALESA